MNNEDIKNIFGQIQTPEFNPAGDIIKKINQGYKVKPKFSWARQITVIAAALIIVLSLTSAALFYFEVLFIDFNGNIRAGQKYYAPAQTEEMIKFEAELLDEKEDNAMLFILKEDEYAVSGMNVQFYYPHKTIEDYEELNNYLKNMESGFTIPEYIPDGYKFTNARIEFQIDDSINYEELDPVYYEEKPGGIYEKYIYPQTGKSVNSISVLYSKGDEELRYNIHYSASDLDNVAFSASPTMKLIDSQILNLPQFERVLLTLYDVEQHRVYNFGAAKLIKPFNIINPAVISKTWREFQIKTNRENYKDDLWTYEMGSLMYSISSASLSQDEIIKMAESIK